MHGVLQDDFPAAFLTEAFEESVSLVLFIGFFAEELIPQLDFLVPHVVGSPYAIRPSDYKD